MSFIFFGRARAREQLLAIQFMTCLVKVETLAQLLILELLKFGKKVINIALVLYKNSERKALYVHILNAQLEKDELNMYQLPNDQLLTPSTLHLTDNPNQKSSEEPNVGNRLACTKYGPEISVQLLKIGPYSSHIILLICFGIETRNLCWAEIDFHFFFPL